MKSVSKMNSPIPGEEPCLLKVQCNHTLKYLKVYRQVDRKAETSRAKGLADSPAPHLARRQSRRCSCPAAGFPLINTFFPFCQTCVTSTPACRPAPSTNCCNTGVAGMQSKCKGTLALPLGCCWHRGLSPGAQPRLVLGQLPLQPGPSPVLLVMKTADKGCTASLSWPSESYLRLNTEKALELHKLKWTSECKKQVNVLKIVTHSHIHIHTQISLRHVDVYAHGRF